MMRELNAREIEMTAGGCGWIIRGVVNGIAVLDGLGKLLCNILHLR